MRKMKQSILYILTIALLASCSPYQKVLNKGKAEDRYKMGTALFDKGEYSKALTLLDKIVTEYTGKPQMERIQLMIAESHYKIKDYNLSGYYFSRFATNYPNSSKHEEALFLAAKGYYLSAPKYSLDQTDTNKAIDVLQQFINAYPNSEKLKEANEIYSELSKRLEKKYFEIAKQFLTLDNYQAAIVALDNFLEDYSGTTYKEEVGYLKFQAAYNLGIKSIQQKKEERIKDALSIFAKFNKEFPASKYLKDLEPEVKTLNNQLSALTK